MTFESLLRELGRRSIELKRYKNEIECIGSKDALDDDILSELQNYKSELLEWIGDDKSTWCIPQSVKTPGMLPLIKLTQEEIDSIIESTPDGTDNIQDIYPLAPLQEGILFHHLISREERDVYLLSSMMAFKKRELLDKFISSSQSVIERHDILRTAILWENLPEPVQVVWRDAEMPVEEVMMDSTEGNVVDLMRERYTGGKYRIDIRKAPMMRVFIAKDDNNERWILVLLFHHLIMDHTTLDIFIQEVGAYIHGAESHLPEALPFRNYVAQTRLGISQEEHEAFFKKMLSDVEEPTAPYDLLDVRGDGSDVEEGWYNIDISLSRRLRDCARKLRISAASVFHLACARVLGSLGNRDDVVFGTVLFGRMQGGERSERVMGMLVNTLPVRIEVKNDGVEEAVKKTHRILTELIHHEHATLTLAQRCSGVEAPMPLFSSLLNYRYIKTMPSEREENKRSGIGIESIYSEEKTNYPFVLSVNDLGEGYSLTVQVQRPVDPNQVCGFMNTVLEHMADALETSPRMAIGNIDVLSDAELIQILYKWNDTGAEYPREKCIHELFEEQVEKSHDAIAVVFENEQLSYSELCIRSNQVACYLLSVGVRTETLIGICVDRSLEMIIGLLGILKAGGAYIPLDPEYPEDRIAFILKDSQASIILTQEKYSQWLSKINDSQLSGDKPILVCLDMDWDKFSLENEDNLVNTTISGNLSYVIYTSGSTGKPKGVQIMHQSLVNFLCSMLEKPGLSDNDVLLSVTTLSFDIAALEIYLPLITGSKLAIIKNKYSYDGLYLFEKLKEYNVTVMQGTPATWQLLLAVRWESTPRLKILCGGEALRKGLADTLMNKGSSVWNMYGPTETTIWSSVLQIVNSGTRSIGDSIESIGRPIFNTQMYILDRNIEPVPVGIAGELVIGGNGLARSYFNRPELTAERFIPAPINNLCGSRLYKTGDLSRYHSDGNIEFIGRIDHQIKIRGFRIELGEIESRLSEIDGINEGVVLAREDLPGEKRLVAYYTLVEDNEEITVDEIRSHLSRHLPDYMIPSAYVVLEIIPLTPNGKTDRKALPAPEGDAYARGEYEAPAGEIEEVLANLWSEVLNVEQVGRNDNFFDLGGHSLLAVKLISRLRTHLDIEVELRELFLNPNLKDLALSIKNNKTCDLPEITIADRSGDIPLSFAQQRLWFIDRFEKKASQAYHIPSGFRIMGELNRGALCAALDRIVERHESLRTTFDLVDDKPVQKIAPPQIGFALKEHDVSDLCDIEVRNIIEKEAADTFDLSAGPLVRGQLLRKSEEEHLFLITMHHIVSDGWSMGIFMNEFSMLYKTFSEGKPDPLPELSIQYADYALWQRNWLKDKILEDQLDYWKTHLSGAPELLELPVDNPRPAIQDYSGGSIGIHFDADLTRDLRAFSRINGITMFMMLLAGWTLLLSRLSNQDDLVIGTPVANRTRAEIEPLIGFFVNTLALRFDLSNVLTISELMTMVRETTLAAQKHQDIPFEQLVEEVKPERSLSYSPLFQVMFAWQNTPAGHVDMEGITLGGIVSHQTTAQFDLNLSLQEVGDEIAGVLNYATAIFERKSIERYIEYFKTLLRSMVSDEAQRIYQLKLLNSVELNRILYEWNDTEAEYPGNKCIHEIFEEQVERTPDAIAVVYEEEEISYRELNVRANQLAHYLVELGVKPDSLVGIGVERSLEMVIAILSILKAGGGYIPLDPEYPEERLSYMLKDSTPTVVLTQSTLKDRWGYLPNCIPIINLDSEAVNRKEYSSKNFEKRGVTSSQLAYVIYTSGSTGAAKGVMVDHGNVVRLFSSTDKWFNFNSDDVWTLFHSYAFDFSVWEIWGALLYGGKLVVVPKMISRSPEEFYSLICREKVSILNQTPSAFKQLMNAQKESVESHSLREVIFGGEALEVNILKPWYDRNGSEYTKLVNMYGITETTVHVTYYPLSPKDIESNIASPIGTRIPDLRMYILDQNGNPAPLGVTGEIYVGGNGVARGYLNRPVLTPERFLPDPFTENPDSRMYRTGDLGKWLPDGTIDFKGRNDFQVKIRGFRIELGEIESRIREIEGIKEAVVIAREEESGDKRLVGYYTLTEGREDIAAEEIKNRLTRHLPEYMVPSAYVVLDKIPLTSNGKTDRKALPAPEGGDYARGEYEAPVGEIEEILSQIWSEVLNVEKVSRNDNFFDLGGHSLLAVKLASRILENLGKEFSIRQLFEYPTISELAPILQKNKNKAIPLPVLEIDNKNRHDPFPLTDIQQAYWIGRKDVFNLGNIGTHGYFEYNISGLDISRYEQALQIIIQRHDMLRMVVTEDGMQQVLKGTLKYRIPVLDLSTKTKEEEKALLEEVRNELSHQVFSGEEWPLFDIRATKLSDGVFKIHYSMDALVMDAESTRIFFYEWHQLYFGHDNDLPKLDISFRDYVLTEQKLKKTVLYKRSKVYWLNRMDDFPLAPDLPLKQDPSKITNPRFERRSHVLEKRLWWKLKKRAKQVGVTPTALLLSCFAEVLGKWSRAPRFTLNLTLFNRIPFHEQVERIIGDFTSLTLLEVDHRKANSISKRLRELQGQLWSDLEHSYFSGVEVQRELSRVLGSTITMPVVVTSTLGLNERNEEGEYSNSQTEFEELDDTAPKDTEDDDSYSISQTPQVWIDHQIHEVNGSLGFNWDCVEGLFPSDMLYNMFSAYKELLVQLAVNEDQWENVDFPFIPTPRMEIREKVNETETSFPSELLQELFHGQALKQKDKTAVIYKEERLSYEELLHISMAIGDELRKKGASPNSLVGLLMNKGWEQVAGSLGILFSGAAYLPIDVSLPKDRISRLLEIGEVKYVLTQPSIVMDELDLSTDVEVIQIEKEKLLGRSIECLDPVQREDDIAYVIFTSGSTGVPKGVVISHKSVVNTLLDINNRFKVSSEDRVFAISSMSFDLSVYDVFGILSAGGTIIIPEETEFKDPDKWLQYVDDEGVTIWDSVPALMQMLVDTAESKELQLPQSLRLVLLSGDWIPTTLPDRIRSLSEGIETISLGGATEGSIWSIYYPITEVDKNWRSIPYGKPLANQTYHVLKPDLSDCPEWVIGDLYIGGMGVAKGYWKDDEKTNSSFIIHPKTGKRLYKTGDLGRYLPDGNIEFLGREDSQVKVQGYRIELGEIESALREHEDVKEALVTTVGEGSDSKSLAAYVIPKETAQDISSQEMQGDDFIEHEDSEGHLSDYADRLEFKISRHGLRKIENSTESIYLSRPDEELPLDLRLSRNRDISFVNGTVNSEKISGMLSVLSSIEIENYPLPKYYYPSAGTLYPVQVYVYVCPGQVEGVSEGYYYYDPVKHYLTLLGRDSFSGAQLLSKDTKFYILLAGELDAIRPMYGQLSEEFCVLEAGYIAQVLAGAANKMDLGFRLNKDIDLNSLKVPFRLEESHYPLFVIEGGRIESSQSVEIEQILEDTSKYCATNRAVASDNIKLSRFDSDIDLGLSLKERQSFRRYSESEIAFDHFYSLVSFFSYLSGIVTEDSMKLYLYIKPDRIEGLKGGYYLYKAEDHCLTYLYERGESSNLIHVGGNQEIHEQSSFSIYIVSKVTDSTLKDTMLFESGFLGQLLMSISPKLELGLCAIGNLRFDKLQEELKLDPDSRYIHCFLGGKLETDQIRHWQHESESLKKQIYKDEFKDFLNDRLPNYMVPSTFIMMESFPLTPNGKIDRGKLPAPEEESYARREYVAPVGEVEEKLSNIWSEVLKVSQVDRNDDFFELGGNSLLAIQVRLRICDVFSVELPIHAIFNAQNIKELSLKIEDTQNEGRFIIPPIEPVSVEGKIPLSFFQEQLWVVHQFAPDNSLYNIFIPQRIKREINITALCQALLEIVRRHEVLRTRYEIIDGEPVQIIGEVISPLLSLVDLSVISGADKDDEINRISPQESLLPFDLERDIMIRARLLLIEQDEFAFLLTIHHIAFDNWSMDIFRKEFNELYKTFSKGEAPSLPELPIQYSDFSVWQREWLSGDVIEKLKAYWKNKLEGIMPIEIPTDHVIPNFLTARGESLSFFFDRDLTDKLKEICHNRNTSLFMILLAVFSILLSRYSNQEDIVITTPTTNRNRKEIEDLIGFFINLFVIRIDLSRNPTFTELMDRVRSTTLDAYSNQDLPFEYLIPELNPKRDMGRHPLTQILFSSQKTPGSISELTESTQKPIESNVALARNEMEIYINEVMGGVLGILIYKTDLYESSTISLMIQNYKRLIEKIVEKPESRISEYSILTKEDIYEQVVLWNDTKVEYPWNRSINEFFEAQVEDTRDAVAAVFEDNHISYIELNRRSNQLACYLQELGVRHETPVAICMDRSLEMIVSIYGILKAGGTYVPLDPDYPEERNAFMLSDSKSVVLLTLEKYSNNISGIIQKESLNVSPVTIFLDNGWNDIAERSGENLELDILSQNASYIIYTSGSTGRPKGVIVLHHGVSNLINFEIDRYDLNPESRVLQFSSVCFDASISEIMDTLSSGGTLYLTKRESIFPGPDLERTVNKYGITHLFLTPSALVLVDPQEIEVPYIIVGGEACPDELARKWCEKSAFFNTYGPTESTVIVTLEEYNDIQKKISIGKPIANTKVFILNSYVDLLPVGVSGELCTGGTGVTRGYLNQLGLTSEKFIPDPFGYDPGSILYRSGDLTRYLKDGNIDYISRIDHQVKIRGFRIELSEIESVMLEHAGIQGAIVTIREDQPGDNRLVAYIVTSEAQEPEVVEIKKYLMMKLPEYMIPSAFVILDELPLTPGGKVDRNNLPEPDKSGLEKEYLAPRTEIEKKLAETWSEVLGIEKIGIQDNFFDLGGHSLKAVKTTSMLKKKEDIDMSIRDLFMYPTIEQLANKLSSDTGILEQYQEAMPLRIIEGVNPLFLVYDGFGEILYSSPLTTTIDTDIPVYGLSHTHYDETPLQSIQDHAARIIRIIKTIQKTGPYRLAGWSIGGTVSYEAAVQLLKEGEVVEFIGLIDTFNFSGFHGGTHPLQDGNQNEMLENDLERNGMNNPQIDPTKSEETILDSEMLTEKRKKEKPIPDDIKMDRIQRNLTSQLLTKVAYNYYPPPISTQIHLFRADEREVAIDDPFLGWGSVIPEKQIRIINAPGTHNSIVRPPHIKKLGRLISEAIKQAKAGYEDKDLLPLYPNNQRRKIKGR